MSYYPPKGMHRNRDGVAVFDSPATPPVPTAKKRWWRVEVLRRAFNGRGEVVRRVKQEADVFGEEEAAPGMGFRRCPDPGMGDGDVRTTVSVYPL